MDRKEGAIDQYHDVIEIVDSELKQGLISYAIYHEIHTKLGLLISDIDNNDKVSFKKSIYDILNISNEYIKNNKSNGKTGM